MAAALERTGTYNDEPIMKKWVKVTPGYALAILGHVAAVFGVAMGTTLLIVPTQHLETVASRLSAVPALWEMSQLSLVLHFALAACIWALICILYKLIQLRIRETKTVATVKLSKGTVVTETLIVTPIFLMLTFGMAQLTVNSIGGILANVAAYEAARAAWIWQPEEDASDRRMGIEDGTTIEKCRIAVAFAMMPVAPGDYLKNPLLDSDFADDARLIAAGANVPLSGVLLNIIGDDIADLGATGFGAGETNPFTGRSYSRSLDASSFVVRSIRKFTTAFLAAGCTVDSNTHEVTMTYRHHIMMPVVGRLFGEFELNGVGNVPGYYSTYTRTFGFQKQLATPNRRLPLNQLRDTPALPEQADDADNIEGDLDQQVEDSDS